MKKKFDVYLCIPALIVEIEAEDAEEARVLVENSPDGIAFLELFAHAPGTIIVEELIDD